MYSRSIDNAIVTFIEGPVKNNDIKSNFTFVFEERNCEVLVVMDKVTLKWATLTVRPGQKISYVFFLGLELSVPQHICFHCGSILVYSC